LITDINLAGRPLLYISCFGTQSFCNTTTDPFTRVKTGSVHTQLRATCASRAEGPLNGALQMVELSRRQAHLITTLYSMDALLS
jgi:hypothetical protein